VEKPQMRSQLRALTLCGIAEEPKDQLLSGRQVPALDLRVLVARQPRIHGLHFFFFEVQWLFTSSYQVVMCNGFFIFATQARTTPYFFFQNKWLLCKN
jgi:hypothetical protein